MQLEMMVPIVCTDEACDTVRHILWPHVPAFVYSNSAHMSTLLVTQPLKRRGRGGATEPAGICPVRCTPRTRARWPATIR